jgi:NodT family efflux transporter outer membrane factor (OMF) lipoprotein
MAAGTSAPWSRGLGDPALDGILARARARNRDLARAVLRLDRAQSTLDQDRLGYLPRLSAGIGGFTEKPLHGTQPSTVLVNGVAVPTSSAPSRFTSFGSSISASYEIDLWGRVRNAAAAGRAERDAGKADLEAARWLLEAQVAEQYWTLAVLESRLALAREAEIDAVQGLDATRVRAEAGVARHSDVDRQAGRVDAARHAARELEAQRRACERALALLLDEVPEGFEAPAARLPQADPPDFSVGPPASVLDRRPDVNAARLRLDGSLASDRVASVNFLPDLSLSAMVSGGGAALREIASNPLGSAGLSISIPFLDAPRLAIERRQSRIQVEDAAIAYREAVYKALVEVEEKFDQRRLLDAQTGNALRQVAALEHRLAAVERRREEGASGTQDVRDAREELRSARAQVLDLRLRSWVLWLGTLKVMGGAVGV